VRVALICPTHFSAKSVMAGAERYSFELAKAMARHTETTLVTFGDEGFESSEGLLKVRCHRRWVNVSGNPMNPFTPAFLRDVLRADVVHCLQYATVATDLAVLAGVLGRKRIFVTDLAGSAAVSLWYRLRLWNGVRSFLLISEYNRAMLQRFPGGKHVIYGGVDTDRFRASSDGRPRETVMFVGRLIAHKGIEVLLDALDPDMKAAVLGQAPSAEYAAALASRASGKQVAFRANCSDSELLNEYQRAWAVALPSLQDSGYTTALEAMSCGVPVVGSSMGSLPELIADGETGFIVPTNDPDALRAKLRLLAADRGLAERMGAAGRRRVEQMFTWDHVVKRCLRHYEGDAAA
jgi:glycosyltransferase involved in cell wall biosynthesis